MNPKLLIMSLLGLACTINGQGTDSEKPVANVPVPSNQLTLDEQLPSPQELEAGMAALNAASRNAGQDMQSAMQSQLTAELARNKIENEMANQMIRNRMENEARINFPPPQETRTNQMLPTGLPRPTDMGVSSSRSRSSGTQADGQISVGNIQAIYNDELRTIMRDYNITPEEIKQMLELYAQGGAATITKERTNPENGLQEIVTLDFENFTSQRPNAPITSVSPMPYNPLPGAASQDPVSTSPPENEDPIQDFLAAERYLRDQIKELDAQFNALNEAYQQGIITRLTRDENARGNRERRRRFITDLRAIQMEIKSRTGGEKMEPEIPLKNRVDGGEFFANAPSEPKPFSVIPREVLGGGGSSPNPTTLRELALQNQMLEEMIRRQERGPGRSGLGFPGSIINLNGPLPPRRQSPPLTGRPRRNMTPEQRAALRRELLNIRRQERLIFQRLSQLRNRNSRLMLPRDPFRQQLRQRLSFSNGNRPQLTRTLSGSVTGQNVLGRRTI
ncbi:uncharacterized protein [Magallana gigas]|uniref:uncharacterized protein n=1 Tax=Magallana gigas TaxID=29159 RepID=UPI0033413FC0